MKKLRMIVVTVLCFGSSLAYAGNTNTNTTSSAAQANAAGNVSNNSPTANSLGVGVGQVKTTIGNTNATANVGNTSASNGSMSVGTTFNQTFKNKSVIPAPLPSTSMAPAGAFTPPIYGHLGDNPIIHTAQVENEIINQCGGIIAMRDEMPTVTVTSGANKQTKITFMPFQAYYTLHKEAKTKTVQVDPMDPNDTVKEKQVNRIRWTETNRMQPSQHYMCLGIAQVRSTVRNGPYFTLLSAASTFPLHHDGFRRFHDVRTIPLLNTLGFVTSESASGHGFGLLGQGLGYASNALSGGGLTATAGFGGGHTTAGALVQMDVLLVVPTRYGMLLPPENGR